MTDLQLSSPVRFGDFEVDLKTGELRKNGIKIRLPGHSFRILTMLLERPGELVTREEIKKRLWSEDTFVDFDNGLNKSMNQLRNLLLDSAENPRYIETLPKLGYRFLAEVKSNGIDRDQSLDEPAYAAIGEVRQFGLEVAVDLKKSRMARLRPSMRWLVFTVICGIAALASFFLLGKWMATKGVPEIKALAVLPLANLSGDPAQEYFSDGMTDAMISELGKIKSLRVISHQSTKQYKDSKKSLPEIARELNVDCVIEGSVVKSGDRVRITAQLLDAVKDQHLWADSFERSMSDVLALQQDVARAVAGQIHLKLSPGEQAALTKHRPVDPEAYQLYLRGRQQQYLWTEDGFVKGIDYFQQALSLDPGFALAYAGLNDCLCSLAWWGVRRPSEVGLGAKAAAQKAVQLDNGLAEAHAALAWALFLFDWDWVTPDAEFQKAESLNPSLPFVGMNYCIFLSMAARHEESIREAIKTYKLDPLSFNSIVNVAYVDYWAGRYEDAIHWLKKAQELDPQNPFTGEELAWNYVQLGRYAEALASLDVSKKKLPLGKDFTQDCLRAYQLAKVGRKAEVKENLDYWLEESKSRFLDPLYFLNFYLGLEDKENSMRMVEKGLADRSVGMLNLGVDPTMGLIKDDPRYQAILREVGFPPSLSKK